MVEQGVIPANLCINIGTLGQQQIRYILIIMRGRIVQGRQRHAPETKGVTKGVFYIDLGTFTNKKLHNVFLAGIGCKVQSCVAKIFL